MTISICLYKKHDAHGNNNHDDFIEKFYWEWNPEYFWEPFYFSHVSPESRAFLFPSSKLKKKRKKKKKEKKKKRYQQIEQP